MSRAPDFISVFLLGQYCSSFLVFYVVLLCVFTFLVPCCDVRYDFHIKTMFRSPLPLVVCRRAHVLLRFCICLHILMCSILLLLIFLVLCCVLALFVFDLCRTCQLLPVSLDFPFLFSLSFT